MLLTTFLAAFPILSCIDVPGCEKDKMKQVKKRSEILHVNIAVLLAWERAPTGLRNLQEAWCAKGQVSGLRREQGSI